MKKMPVFAAAVVLLLGLGSAPVVRAYEGYEAGRQWARENNVIDPDFESDDHSNAFNEGVRQYAIEQRGM